MWVGGSPTKAGYLTYLGSPTSIKGAIYFEAIGMVIFSHVKITCYFYM